MKDLTPTTYPFSADFLQVVYSGDLFDDEHDNLLMAEFDADTLQRHGDGQWQEPRFATQGVKGICAVSGDRCVVYGLEFTPEQPSQPDTMRAKSETSRTSGMRGYLTGLALDIDTMCEDLNDSQLDGLDDAMLDQALDT